MDDGGRKREGKNRTHATLCYPGHAFNPEDLLDFIELTQFTKRWDKLGLDDEEDLTALQLSIMINPKGGDVIPGAGGLRKLRFAPESWQTGTRGAARVLYKYFEEFGVVLLCVVYGKGEQANISDAVKNFLRKTLDDIEKELHRIKAIKVQ